MRNLRLLSSIFFHFLLIIILPAKLFATEPIKIWEENAEIKIIKEGLELTLRGFEGSLESAGINPFNPEGETFNPEKHEAISVLEDDKKKENTIIEVIQRGFTIQGRILRPAKVVVTKHSNKK